uniref:G-protein coupled receptors family 1 profile domain-containing protein n=1 Tax=Haemonchus contortus TaxID=6289 RepID=W6NCJ0_HAECO
MGLGLLVPPSTPYLQSYDEKPWHIDIATLSMLMISGLCFLVLAIVVVCYAFILRTIRKFKEENGTLNNEETRRVHGTTKKASSDCSNGSRRSRMQAMSRHKYIYVIGTVLIVDLLFLCPYSGIQLVAFLHINHLIEITHSSTLIRWWLQVFIGVHSVCQPLCYFRMTEFRRLACCSPRMPWNRSRSFSHYNRTYLNTRSVIRDEDLLEAPESPLTSEPLLVKDRLSPALEISPSNSWSRERYNSFRTFINGTEEVRFRLARVVTIVKIG